jgi:uronate dehydrogenase
MKEPILITGGAGHVAGLISPLLRREFRLRRIDTVEQEPEGQDEVVRADVCDLEAMRGACDGVAAVVHLAAQPAEADFRTVLLPRNLDGTWAAYEAAVRAGVRRFVFASTIQVVDGYPLETFVSPESPPRPVSVYGCTKVFGEALGRFHSDASGLGVACLRLGAVVPPDHPRLATDARFRSLWCDPGDLARLVVAAIRSDVPFATVIAVSPPATSRFDTANPFGWQPVGQPCSSGGRSATM